MYKSLLTTLINKYFSSIYSTGVTPPLTSAEHTESNIDIGTHCCQSSDKQLIRQLSGMYFRNPE